MCEFILEACLKTHKSTEIEIENHIGEYLKHAPHKPGGSKYKVISST
jgi:hypothetical protein